MISAGGQPGPLGSNRVDLKKKARLGQFFTPPSIAHFMAGLFERRDADDCRLLDAGAGTGSLSSAFLERWACGELSFRRVELDAFEVDESLHSRLTQALAKYSARPGFHATIRGGDFITTAADWLSGGFLAGESPRYTHAILNPPYKKMRSDSDHREALRQAGIETVNLYSAFVALSLSLLDRHGQLVAIIPRSFCNGPYYRPFREYILQHAAIRHIHLFNSRSKAFKDDDVLQENIVIGLERGGKQGPVAVSTSTDHHFSDLETQRYPFRRIVLPSDPARFIHIPVSTEKNAFDSCLALRHSLEDLGIKVSTGPVVDFRLKEYLRDMPEPDTVPLLYPGHFIANSVQWPRAGGKKPNAIQHNSNTEKWLYPTGFYCVVRRFSSKEEKRRIVASVVDPSMFTGASQLGFENHLNVFHENKHGLPSRAMAAGLAAFLNTTAVDEHFRCFNGHTQVNATDLRLIKYPSRAILAALGNWALEHARATQEMIDGKLESLTA